MKVPHFKSLKFHALFTLLLTIVCIGVLFVQPDWALAASCILLVLYVGGNGIIHSRKNQLSRDSLIEYSLVAGITLLIVLSAVIK